MPVDVLAAATSTGHPNGFGGRAGTLVLALLVLVVAVGSIITVYQIGDSGARAAWTGHFSEQANLPRHTPQLSAGDLEVAGQSGCLARL